MAWAVVATQAAVGLAELPQVGDVLAQYARTRKASVGILYVRSRTIEEFDGSGLPRASVRLAQQEFYRRGPFIDLYTDGPQAVAAVDDANLPTFHPTRQALWNGTARYHVYRGESSARSYVAIDKRPSTRAESILASLYLGAPLEGYFLGDEEDILTILREELPADASVRRMSLGGTLCYVLEAYITGRGHYQLYFDPEHGCNICRAQVVRDGNDLPAESRRSRGPLGTRKLSAIRFVLGNVAFKELEGAWIPVAGEWEFTRVYENGTVETMTRYHRCLKMVVGESGGEHAFLPRNAKGVVVYTVGERSGIRYVWGDGGPQPDVDWEIVRAIDDAVATRRRVEPASRGNEHPVLPVAEPAVLSSQTPSGSAEHVPPRDTGTPMRYCGLYCMYAALRLSGAATDFSSLLDSKYLRSSRGSSLAELQRAARDHQLYAEPVGRLTTADLMASPHSLVLHVKRDLRSQGYDHYVLFLGKENGQAVVCDPPRMRQMALADLISRWDGNALAVSRQPIETCRLVRRGRAMFFTSCAVALCAVGTIRVGRRVLPSFQEGCSLRRKIGLTMTQAALLASVLVLLALAHHCLRDVGLMGRANAAGLVRDAHVADFLPRVEPARVEGLIDDGVVFVDARRRPDYEAGHLRGAINLPVDANDSDFVRITKEIPPDSRIVVYCQSRRCPFADTVARGLVRHSFLRVSILRGGWYEWSKWKARKEN